jgi:hypothetical protein
MKPRATNTKTRLTTFARAPNRQDNIVEAFRTAYAQYGSLIILPKGLVVPEPRHTRSRSACRKVSQRVAFGFLQQQLFKIISGIAQHRDYQLDVSARELRSDGCDHLQRGLRARGCEGIVSKR